MSNKPIQRLKDEPRGVWHETRNNLVTSKYGRGGRNVLVQPYVEQVYDRLRRDLYDKGYTDMDMFSLVSGFRTKEEQDALFQRAVQKYGSEANARKWVAKVSPHNTGAAIDVYLGYSLDSANVNKIFDTPQYRDFASYAYHNYKMAPYEAEPWHWECGEACRENIEQRIAQENQPKVIVASNTPTNQYPIPQQNQQVQMLTESQKTPTSTSKPPKQQIPKQQIPKPQTPKNEISTTTAVAIGVGSLVVVSGIVLFATKSRKKKAYKKSKR